MKIVSVMTTTSAGGAEFAAVELLDALAEAGDEVVMVSNMADIGRGTRVRIAPIDIGPKLSKRSWRSLLIRWPIIARELYVQLRSLEPYDVLLVHYKKEQLLAATLPRRLRPALVWAEWGPVPYPLRRGLPRAAFLAAARRADAIMAISAGTKRSLEEVGVPAAKVSVVPNTVDTDGIRFSAAGRSRVRGELGIGSKDFVVGCISRFHPKKRNDVVVEAVRQLQAPDVHLIMAGSGETEPQLRTAAQPLGDRAHFVPTPTTDVADVLSAFDVIVFCPSPTEGAPRATILGMLASRPCLATGPEGVDDLIRPEFGAITEPLNDSRALAELLRRYYADPGLRERQGSAARRWAEGEFAKPAVAARVKALIARVGGGG